MGERYDLGNLPTERSEIENLLAQVEGEIAEISEQMLTEDKDDGWAARARGARKLRFSIKAKLERRLNALRPPAQSDRVAIATSKLEAQRLNAEAAKCKAAQKASNVEASNIEQRRKLGALIRWLRAEHPELVEQAFAAMDEAKA